MSEENKDLTAPVEETQEAAEKKSEKVQKKANKKPNVFVRAAKWFHELRVEAKKVVWPTGKAVWKNTVVVLVVAVVLCAVITVLDVVFGGVRDFIARLI